MKTTFVEIIEIEDDINEVGFPIHSLEQLKGFRVVGMNGEQFRLANEKEIVKEIAANAEETNSDLLLFYQARFVRVPWYRVIEEEPLGKKD